MAFKEPLNNQLGPSEGHCGPLDSYGSLWITPCNIWIAISSRKSGTWDLQMATKDLQMATKDLQMATKDWQIASEGLLGQGWQGGLIHLKKAGLNRMD